MAGTFASFMEESIKRSNSGGGFDDKRNFEYFSLSDGETKVYRFVTGFAPMLSFNHECGLEGFEVSELAMEEARQAGSPIACPKCKKQFTESDIVARRPMSIGAVRHGFVRGEGGKPKSFTCLGEGCPICAAVGDDGKQVHRPRDLAFMFAIEQKVETETGFDETTGAPKRVIKSVTDKTDENGNIIFTQFERPPSFFAPIFSLFKEDGRADHYLFNITRVGEKLETRYIVDRMNSEPLMRPLASYANELNEAVEQAQKYINGSGTKEFYAKNGWVVADPSPTSTSWADVKNEVGASYL